MAVFNHCPTCDKGWYIGSLYVVTRILWHNGYDPKLATFNQRPHQPRLFIRNFCKLSFRLLTDFVCLLIYEFCLSLWKIARCSVILLLPLFMCNERIFSNTNHFHLCPVLKTRCVFDSSGRTSDVPFETVVFHSGATTCQVLVVNPEYFFETIG